MQCACYIAESLDGHPLRLNPCPEHERWAKAIRDYEREACAKIAEGDDMLDGTGLEIAAAIRARSTLKE